MKIHSKIRDEIVALLQANLPDVDHFYNGRPSFINIDEEQQAIAVFLDEATFTQYTTCNETWEANLNIAIYIKSVENGENELDDLAQKVVDILDKNQLETVNDISLSGYSYEQDQQQRTWYVANIQFDIEYEFLPKEE